MKSRTVKVSGLIVFIAVVPCLSVSLHYVSHMILIRTSEKRHDLKLLFDQLVKPWKLANTHHCGYNENPGRPTKRSGIQKIAVLKGIGRARISDVLYYVNRVSERRRGFYTGDSARHWQSSTDHASRQSGAISPYGCESFQVSTKTNVKEKDYWTNLGESCYTKIASKLRDSQEGIRL